MERLENTQVMAQHGDVTREQAIVFCRDVQACFTQDPPSPSEIGDCLHAHPQMRRIPSIVAAVIRVLFRQNCGNI